MIEMILKVLIVFTGLNFKVVGFFNFCSFRLTDTDNIEEKRWVSKWDEKLLALCISISPSKSFLSNMLFISRYLLLINTPFIYMRIFCLFAIFIVTTNICVDCGKGTEDDKNLL